MTAPQASADANAIIAPARLMGPRFDSGMAIERMFGLKRSKINAQELKRRYCCQGREERSAA